MRFTSFFHVLLRITLVQCLLLIVGCSKGEVTLEIENTEVFFLDSLADNYWLQYKDESERKKAQNIITYRLTNTTEKKLLFVFDQLNPEPSIGISPDTQHYGYIGFTIKDKDRKIKMPDATMVTSVKTGDLFDCQLHELEKRRDLYGSLGIASGVNDFNNFIHNAVIINPGETRTFKAIVYLPLLWERDKRTESGNLSYRHLVEGDKFQLFYYCKAANLKWSLPKYIRDDLAKNNIEIFDGKLEAVAIKLKEKSGRRLLKLN